MRGWLRKPMKTDSSEDVLIRQPIHWGVYIPPTLYTLAMVVPVLAGLYALSVFSRMFVGLTGTAGTLGILWLPMLLPIAMGVILVFMVWLEAHGAEQVLTNRRLRFRTGWLCRAVGELPLEKVEATLLVEPFLGQLFGYGTVVVIGTGGTRFVLAYLPKPHSFHMKLQQALDAIRTGHPLKLAEDLEEATEAKPSRFAGLLDVPPAEPNRRREPKATRDRKPPVGPARHVPQGTDKTPLEHAWDELNKPLPASESDDSRFMPKG